MELFNWLNKPKWIDEEKHKKTCKSLRYIERLLISAPTATIWVFIFAFGFLIDISIGIASSEFK